MNATQPRSKKRKPSHVAKMIFYSISLRFVHFFYFWFLVGTPILSCTSCRIEHLSINECNNFITLTFAWANRCRCGGASSSFCRRLCGRAQNRFCCCTRFCGCSLGGCVCSIYIAIWPYSWIFWWTFGQELTVWLKITDRTTTARNLFTFVIHEMSCRTNSKNFKWDQNRNQKEKYYLL